MNDNNEKPDRIERAIDEMELAIRIIVDEMTARRIVVQLIPIVGQLVRDVMNDTAEDVMDIFRGTGEEK